MACTDCSTVADPQTSMLHCTGLTITSLSLLYKQYDMDLIVQPGLMGGGEELADLVSV